MEKSGGGRPPESGGGCRGEAEDAEEGLEGAEQENTREHHERHPGGGGGHRNHAPTMEDQSPGRGEADRDAEGGGAGGAEKKGGGGSGWRVGGGPDLLYGWLCCRRGHKGGAGVVTYRAGVVVRRWSGPAGAMCSSYGAELTALTEAVRWLEEEAEEWRSAALVTDTAPWWRRCRVRALSGGSFCSGRGFGGWRRWSAESRCCGCRATAGWAATRRLTG